MRDIGIQGLFPRKFRKTTIKEDYWHCSTARQYEDLCGNKGKYYVSVDNFEAIY